MNATIVRSLLTCAFAALLLAAAPAASAGTLTVTDLGANTQKTGVLETWTVQFTTSSPVTGNGDVRVMFPPGFQVMDDPPATCRFVSPGTIQYASSFAIGREVLCLLGGTDTIAAGASVKVEINGVRNPTTSQTTEPFLIQTRDQNDTVIDQDQNNTEAILVHGFASAVDHQNPNLVVGAVSTHRFTFTLYNGWAPWGYLELTLPSGYLPDVAGSGTTVASFTRGGSGTFGTPITEGRTMYFQRQGGDPLYGGTQVSINVTQIRNPSMPGVTEPFTVTTSNGTKADHDTGMAPGDTITSGYTPTESSEPYTGAAKKEAGGFSAGFETFLLVAAVAGLVSVRRKR